jgi:hypothetical protein
MDLQYGQVRPFTPRQQMLTALDLVLVGGDGATGYGSRATETSAISAARALRGRKELAQNQNLTL